MCSRSATKAILADIRRTVQADNVDGYTIGLTKWGFPAPKAGMMTWNARDDRLTQSPMWSPHAGRALHHCIVVATHLYEAIDGAGRVQGRRGS